MSAIWLQHCDLETLVRARRVSGELSLARLPRVSAAVLPDSGPFEFRIGFEAVDGLVTVDGVVRGALRVSCQRCLDAMPIAIHGLLRVALARSEQDAQRAPAGFEPLVVADGRIRLADLVEDEILLEIPISSRHAPGDCGPLADAVRSLRPVAGAADTTTPFAGLAEMLRDKGD